MRHFRGSIFRGSIELPECGLFNLLQRGEDSAPRSRVLLCISFCPQKLTARLTTWSLLQTTPASSCQEVKQSDNVPRAARLPATRGHNVSQLWTACGWQIWDGYQFQLAASGPALGPWSRPKIILWDSGALDLGQLGFFFQSVVNVTQCRAEGVFVSLTLSQKGPRMRRQRRRRARSGTRHRKETERHISLESDYNTQLTDEHLEISRFGERTPHKAAIGIPEPGSITLLKDDTAEHKTNMAAAEHTAPPPFCHREKTPF